MLVYCPPRYYVQVTRMWTVYYLLFEPYLPCNVYCIIGSLSGRGRWRWGAQGRQVASLRYSRGEQVFWLCNHYLLLFLISDHKDIIHSSNIQQSIHPFVHPTIDPSITIHVYVYTGCSLNIVVFFQEFAKVCYLLLASTRLLLFVQKIIIQ